MNDGLKNGAKLGSADLKLPEIARIIGDSPTRRQYLQLIRNNTKKGIPNPQRVGCEKEIKVCVECGSRLIKDYVRGELLCAKCGLVFEEFPYEETQLKSVITNPTGLLEKKVEMVYLFLSRAGVIHYGNVETKKPLRAFLSWRLVSTVAREQIPGQLDYTQKQWREICDGRVRFVNAAMRSYYANKKFKTPSEYVDNHAYIVYDKERWFRSFKTDLWEKFMALIDQEDKDEFLRTNDDLKFYYLLCVINSAEVFKGEEIRGKVIKYIMKIGAIPLGWMRLSINFYSIRIFGKKVLSQNPLKDLDELCQIWGMKRETLKDNLDIISTADVLFPPFQ